MSLMFEIGIIVFLVILNGFLAMSELAMVSARRSRLGSMADPRGPGGGSRGARAALRLAENPGKFLSTVQIGITLVGVLAGAYSGATLSEPLADWLRNFAPVASYADTLALTLVVASVTYASLIVGELVPKQIALSDPEAVAAFVAPPMTLLARVAAPLVWFLDVSSTAILSLLRLKSREQAMSEEEIRAALTESTAAGVLKPEEREMMGAVMHFADRKIRSVMTPRMEVVWLNVEDPPETIVQKIRQSPRSRYPVCRGDLDNLLGVALARDVLNDYLDGTLYDLENRIRPVEVMPDNVSALTILDHLKRSPMHFAVVVDEYGSVEGVVTAADVLSSLVGGITEIGEPVVPKAVQREDGSWLIDGDMDIHAAADLLGLSDLSGDGYATIAGFVLFHFRTVPQEGESFDEQGWCFEVIDMDGRRIDKILAVPLPGGDEDGGGI